MDELTHLTREGTDKILEEMELVKKETVEQIKAQKREIISSFLVNVCDALDVEYSKIYNTTKNKEALVVSVNSLMSLGIGKLDDKGKELVKENVLFCMLCRNRVWGLTKLVPDFAADYLTLEAFREFENTYNSCGVSGVEVKATLGGFLSLMKERPR